jgi:hypothetical protein
MRDLGAQDPNLHNSPIAQPVLDMDDESIDEPAVDDSVPGVCLFNEERFEHGSYVRSGDTILRCENGIWTDIGPTRPEEL